MGEKKKNEMGEKNEKKRVIRSGVVRINNQLILKHPHTHEMPMSMPDSSLLCQRIHLLKPRHR
jgi:hypothetical protein